MIIAPNGCASPKRWASRSSLLEGGVEACAANARLFVTSQPVRTYAADHGLPFDAAEAVNWATRRGSRSGRVAWQYVVDLAGRSSKKL